MWFKLLEVLLGKWVGTKFQKELETHKSELQKTIYVSKARFDTEFQIYRELSESFSKIHLELITLIDKRFNIVFDESDIGNFGSHAEKLCYEQFQRIYSVAPFVTEDIWEEAVKLYRSFRITLNCATDIDEDSIKRNQRSEVDYKVPRAFVLTEEQEKEETSIKNMNGLWEQTEENYNAFIKMIRTHMDSLEIASSDTKRHD